MAEPKRIPPPDPSSPRKPSSSSLLAWAPLYLKRVDRVVERLNKIISTPAGTDSLLNAACYSALLGSVVLERGVKARAGEVVRRAVGEGGKGSNGFLGGGLGFVGGYFGLKELGGLDTAKRLKVLSALISEMRMMSRLFGLFSLWAWGKRVLLRFRNGEIGDRTALGIESVQVFANIIYQVLENGAYLSGKGVLAWNKDRQKAAWLWSTRAWGVHVALDFVRLGREYAGRMRLREKVKEVGEEGIFVGEGESERVFWRRWKRQMVTGMAYAPLIVHWGTEGGVLGEELVAVLGCVAGWSGLRENWRRSGEK
ncbi:hypothetical protein GLAREA_06020 [Glarea lozoyensis ATCC 20868]|uniref:Peroxisomal membrane protein 11C n=1 Tax=Glarea lozoyensis (strain ATCC 20868 / MF5171) TaxID=1116229 RepID=S3E3J0_GLAL2|nr:uncharacterized protein GLAREA_06020 [Glarea lozoyensis ATCC 20868]EPE33008.1 hypothetical protein GLAREA_06020 [Glarea lozoyensis ATCC 20868]